MEVQREIVLPTTREDAWEALTEPGRNPGATTLLRPGPIFHM